MRLWPELSARESHSVSSSLLIAYTLVGGFEDVSIFTAGKKYIEADRILLDSVVMVACGPEYLPIYNFD